MNATEKQIRYIQDLISKTSSIYIQTVFKNATLDNLSKEQASSLIDVLKNHAIHHLTPELIEALSIGGIMGKIDSYAKRETRQILRLNIYARCYNLANALNEKQIAFEFDGRYFIIGDIEIGAESSGFEVSGTPAQFTTAQSVIDYIAPESDDEITSFYLLESEAIGTDLAATVDEIHEAWESLRDGTHGDFFSYDEFLELYDEIDEYSFDDADVRDNMEHLIDYEPRGFYQITDEIRAFILKQLAKWEAVEID